MEGAWICLSIPLTVDSCKAPHDDGHAPKVPGLQGRMLPAATLTIVGIPDHNPRHPLGLEEEGEEEGGRWKRGRKGSEEETICKNYLREKQ